MATRWVEHNVCAVQGGGTKHDAKAIDVLVQCAEQRRVVIGRARFTMLCDSCGERIDAGQLIAAVTILAAGQPQKVADFPEWESEYVDQLDDEEEVYEGAHQA